MKWETFTRLKALKKRRNFNNTFYALNDACLKSGTKICLPGGNAEKKYDYEINERRIWKVLRSYQRNDCRDIDILFPRWRAK